MLCCLTGIQSVARRTLVLLAVILIAPGCVSDQTSGPKSSEEGKPGAKSLDLGFLVFGDTGYHIDYIEEEDYTPPKSSYEEFVAAERREWIEDVKPIEDFVPAPALYLEDKKSYVVASGMDPVAASMKSYCKAASCKFGIMLGDNIYPDGATLGADGHDDTLRFDRLFTQPYSKLGQGVENFRIYVTLGNHDWRTSRAGALAQLHFMETTPPFYMDGLFYKVSPPSGGGEIELFVVHTTLMLGGETVKATELNADGSERVTDEIEEFEPWTAPANEGERNMVSWLEKALRESNARWKFVVGHHPIWSTGGSKFEQARVLRKLLLPSLCRYADAYFVGHEHTLEVHEDSCESVFGSAKARPLVEVLSGAAAKQRGVNSAFQAFQSATNPTNTTLFTKGMIWGFAHMQVNGDQARVTLLTTPESGDGEAVEVFSHEFSRRSGATDASL